MDFLIWFFKSLTFGEWLKVMFPVEAIYWLLIGPILFKLWIIPRIEKRYHKKILYNYPAYFIPSTRWAFPHIEISLYIFAKYMGWPKLLKSPYLSLTKLNYDVSTASKAEIVMSFVAVFFFFLSIASVIAVATH
jgi:hypothetical protein